MGFGLYNWFNNSNRNVLEKHTIEGESPVYERWVDMAVSRVARGTWNLVWICGDHPVRLNTTWWPIVEQYREGKVKRTPGGEWNRIWNPMFTSRQSTLYVQCRTFCRTVQRVIRYGKVKYYVRYVAEAKASVNSAFKSYLIDPKPGDLSMVRMKLE